MKITLRRLFVISLLSVILLSVVVVKYKEKISLRSKIREVLWKIDPYHGFRTSLFGDPAKDLVERKLISQESRINFSTNEENTRQFREKWKFRAESISENNGQALVEDVDKDGIPDVFLGSGQTKVYRLNGLNGETVWEYTLPFGLTSTIAYILVDLDNDGMKEFVFGSTVSHPIRVYALRTGKIEKNRVFWKRNVGGDFFQGGLNYFRTSKGEVRVVSATRDAPYARGSINILDGFGERIVQEIPGFDVCNNRPTFLDLNNDGELDVLTGSHGFFGAKYANNLTAIDSLTGRIMWSRPVGTDTGAVTFLILDIDNDGKKEILVPSISHNNFSKLLIFTPDGQKKGEIHGPNEYIATFLNPDGDITLLASDFQKHNSGQTLTGKLVSRNLKTMEINYQLPLITSNIISVLDLDDDDVPEILSALKIDNVLTLLVVNAYSGKLKSVYQLNSKEEIKPQDREPALFKLIQEKAREYDLIFEKENIAFLQSVDSITLIKALFNLSLPDSFKELLTKVIHERGMASGVLSGVLVDLDADGYWELLGMENPYQKVTFLGDEDPEKGYYTAYDLPFPVLKGYDTNNLDTAFLKNLFKPREES
jgi:hypothetical protein